jgi:hypothetical protein
MNYHYKCYGCTNKNCRDCLVRKQRKEFERRQNKEVKICKECRENMKKNIYCEKLCDECLNMQE